mmetsp:Transcript_2384/g.9138  ORF Transcript_2384/g.9138 Transcript_2384/m.9138 type:complete len:918 (-) Transcript_2384:818-3571(-)
MWDIETSSLLKSWEVCDLPVRSCKFVSRRSQFVCASDDMRLRVYNYNTMEKLKDLEAHADYIRYIEVHPSQPVCLSSSDDMSIKLWNWDQSWECTSSFEGHSHYVMMTRFNCKDTNTFASASLDRSIKVWGLGSQQPHFSLEGHERGVNCIDYYPGGDKPYLLSGADDKTVKIWDYQTKACIQTLEGHSNNVCAVLFHPRLPVLVSASEDGTVRIWHSTTYRAETTLNYGLERAWSLAVAKNSNGLAIGYDEGTILVKLGHDAPVASLDTHTGKLVWANNNDIQSVSLRGLASDCVDGERIPLAPKDMGSCEIFPQNLQHNCNGRFLVVCGDGEYIIYTSQALRNKAFGQALDFVWSAVGTGDYAIRESLSRVKIFKNFKEHRTLKVPISAAEGIIGGACLAVRGSDCVCFFEWTEGTFLCKIDVIPTVISWNETHELVILICEEQAFILKYNRNSVEASLTAGTAGSSGVADVLEPLHEVTERIVAGQWVGDCFIFSNASSCLNYLVGGNTTTICHLDGAGSFHMLGYIPKEDRIFLMDRSYAVVSYKVLLPVLQYQTAVVRQDFETANVLLPSIPESELSSIARFLEAQGYKDVAMQVSHDPDHKFDLAIELNQVDVARSILDKDAHDLESTEYQAKWKRLGDLALANSDFDLAGRCARNAMDFPGLLMLHTSAGNLDGAVELAELAETRGFMNVAFLAYFILGRVEECFELLIKTNRIPEAAFFARTYLPSRMSEAVHLWRTDLRTVSEHAATALADPDSYPNLFPDLEWAGQVEDLFKANRDRILLASNYPTAIHDLDLDLIALLKAREGGEQTPGSDLKFSAKAVLSNTSSIATGSCSEARGEDQLHLKDDAIAVVATMNHDSSDKPSETPASQDQAAYIAAIAPEREPDSVQDEADAILNDNFADDDDDDW